MAHRPSSMPVDRSIVAGPCRGRDLAGAGLKQIAACIVDDSAERRTLTAIGASVLPSYPRTHGAHRRMAVPRPPPAPLPRDRRLPPPAWAAAQDRRGGSTPGRATYPPAARRAGRESFLSRSAAD